MSWHLMPSQAWRKKSLSTQTMPATLSNAVSAPAITEASNQPPTVGVGVVGVGVGGGGVGGI